jgi:hypothetical protein
MKKIKNTLLILLMGFISLVSCEKESLSEYVEINDAIQLRDTVHDTIKVCPVDTITYFNITTCFLFDDDYNKNEMALYNFKMLETTELHDKNIYMTIIIFNDGPKGPEIIDSSFIIITDDIGTLNINKQQHILKLSLHFTDFLDYNYVYNGSFINTDELPSYEDVYRNLLNKKIKNKLIFY